MSCPICAGIDTRLLHTLYDDRYGYVGRYPLRRCRACGHVWLDADFTPDTLRTLYSDYYPRSQFDLDDHQPYQERNGLGAWLDGDGSAPFRWVPKAVRILDIGCGFGETLGYHRARGCDAHGVEVDENIRRVADRFGYQVRTGLFDPNVYEPDSFDYVTMGQVIEHVTDPLETLRGVARVLKPGGRAILSTPNVDGWGRRVFGARWVHWHTPYHLQFFTVRSMRMAARGAGMVLDHHRTLTPSAWLNFQWLHMVTRQHEGRVSPFWKPGSTAVAPRRTIRRILSLAHRFRLNHAFSRIADLARMGDNRLYFLRKPAGP